MQHLIYNPFQVLKIVLVFNSINLVQIIIYFYLFFSNLDSYQIMVEIILVNIILLFQLVAIHTPKQYLYKVLYKVQQEFWLGFHLGKSKTFFRMLIIKPLTTVQTKSQDYGIAKQIQLIQFLLHADLLKFLFMIKTFFLKVSLFNKLFIMLQTHIRLQIMLIQQNLSKWGLMLTIHVEVLLNKVKHIQCLFLIIQVIHSTFINHFL
ncbi:transmembrane protein, putative (macronuclear) [Tetrahymena thermophila SB210]|uniref:Transmembrane protein, putative n=1 Tax=Tetrahymena thermophila (strain SB210) TaxID=312017 RepID=W7WYM2_TETTS|nr:transmembrane protein, putative [Tetrahymena thermophila SB210]EWS71990.1 transmembrane protein, putative [Tetrahymena thermophila SB210]|eukprot:XP_012655490.1 transmembrane protein, putative [Tetrahymena thermophila SB210]